jgi:tetratricopeptide (TPR) repeat protein
MTRVFLCVALMALGCAAAGSGSPAPGTSPPGAAPEGDNVLESRTVGPIVARAEGAMQAEDFETAIELYRAAFERTPWNTRLRDALAAAHAGRARQARERGRFRELPAAEADLRAALELRPGDPDLERNLAVVLAERASVDLDPARAGELRQEARALDPHVEASLPARRADLERRLDLAFELLERGQLDAGIQRLRSLRAGEPDYRPATLLLAQALVRKGSALHGAGRYAEAGAALDDAVDVYRDLGPCGSGPCSDAELRQEVAKAHQSRIVAWLEAVRLERAEQALEDAESAGLSFPQLRRVLPDSSSGSGAR